MLFAVYSPAGVSGCRGRLTAFVLWADIPAVVRTRALEAMGGHLDSSRDILTLRKQWADSPPGVNQIGHCILSVVACGWGRSRSGTGPDFSASCFEWTFVNKRPNLPNGGLHVPFFEDGLRRLGNPQTLSACIALTSGMPRMIDLLTSKG